MRVHAITIRQFTNTLAMKIEKKSQNPFFIHHPDQVNDVVVRGDHFLQHLLIYVGHVQATHADVRF